MTEFEKYAGLGRGISTNICTGKAAQNALEYGMIDQIMTKSK